MLTQKQKIVSVFHLILAAFLIYVGAQNIRGESVPPVMYWILAILGGIAFIYHGYRLVTGKDVNWKY